jgi:hypothetical protein
VSVERDAQLAADLFQSLWPRISGYLGGGSLIRCEPPQDSDLKRQLDMKAGIDFWQVLDKGMRGLSIRFNYQDYRTFTLRYKTPYGGTTEVEKRFFARDNKCTLPDLHIQLVYVGDCLKGLAWTDIKELLRFIEQEKCFGGQNDLGYYLQEGKQGQFFYVIPWDNMSRLGYQVTRQESIT